MRSGVKEEREQTLAIVAIVLKSFETRTKTGIIHAVLSSLVEKYSRVRL